MGVGEDGRAKGAKVLKRKVLRRVAVVFAAAVLVAAIVAAGVLRQRDTSVKAIDALVARLSDKMQRDKAEQQLVAVTDSTGLRRIVWHLGDEDPAVRDEIVSIIGKIGARAVEPLADATRRAYRRAPAWSRRNPKLRWFDQKWRQLFPESDYERWGLHARAWLPKAYKAIGAPAHGAIIEMLSDKYTRRDALLWLGWIADPRDLDLFITYLGRYATDPVLAAHAARGLGELKAARERRRWEGLPADDAAWREFDRRSAEAVQALVASMACPEEDVRRSAVFALGEYRDSAAAMEAILAVVRNTEEVAEVVAAAMAHLEGSQDPAVRKTLFGLLGDSAPQVRAEAVDRLRYDRDSGTPRRVAALLGSSDSLVRESAMSFFTGSWEEANVLLLAQVYGSLDEVGRRNAITAIEQIRDGAYAQGQDSPAIVKTRAKLQRAAEEALRQIQAGEPASLEPASQATSYEGQERRTVEQVSR